MGYVRRLGYVSAETFPSVKVANWDLIGKWMEKAPLNQSSIFIKKKK